jgi:hypothetical protein
MRRQFGSAFDDYVARVSRWLLDHGLAELVAQIVGA